MSFRSTAATRPRRRYGLRATLALTLLLGASIGTAQAASPPPSVTPAATSSFASFDDADGGTLDGSSFSVTYDFELPPLASDPVVVNTNLSLPFFDPPGSATQPALDLPIANGAVVIAFDSPITNFSLYLRALRFANNGNGGPQSYNLVTTGSGAWTFLSGAGVINGNNLSTSFPSINGVITFVGTLTEVRIETVGDCLCRGDRYVLGLASVDAEVGAPTVTSVSPTEGPAEGGTTITVQGTGFGSGTSATIGGAACGELTVISETEFSCVTPAGTLGTADLVVTALGGSVTSAGAFTYVDPPGPGPDPGPGPGPGPGPSPGPAPGPNPSPDPTLVTPSFTG